VGRRAGGREGGREEVYYCIVRPFERGGFFESSSSTEQKKEREVRRISCFSYDRVIY